MPPEKPTGNGQSLCSRLPAGFLLSASHSVRSFSSSFSCNSPKGRGSHLCSLKASPFPSKLCSLFLLHQGTQLISLLSDLFSINKMKEITFIKSSSKVLCHLMYSLSCPAYFMCLIILQFWVIIPHFKRYSLSWNNYSFFPVLHLIL